MGVLSLIRAILVSFSCLILLAQTGCRLYIQSVQAPGSVRLDSDITMFITGSGKYEDRITATRYGLAIEIPMAWEVIDANATAYVLGRTRDYSLERDLQLEKLFKPEPGYKVWAGSAEEDRTYDAEVVVKIRLHVQGTTGTFLLKAIASAFREKWQADSPQGVTDFSQVQDPEFKTQVTVFRFPLPDSGQEKCYDNDWEIECPSRLNTFFAQDAQQFGPRPTFKANNDGTVTDVVTGLQWMQNTADVNLDGNIDEADRIDWESANTYCDGLQYAGFDDWRLPSVNELATIVDFGRRNPSINQLFFQCPPGLDVPFWSKDAYNSHVYDQDQAWVVGFYIGRVDVANATETAYVRCVRGTSPYEPRNYIVVRTGVVLDTSTGLMWFKSPVDKNHDGNLTTADTFTWSEALDYCESSTFAGYDDWRLPNIREYISLIHPPSSRIDQIFNLGSYPLFIEWTSTSRTIPNAYLAWDFNLLYGSSLYSFKTGKSPIRCVRGGLMLPGDFDRDGDVDGMDLVRLKWAYLALKYDHVCDLNHDGSVDGDDVYLYTHNYSKELY